MNADDMDPDLEKLSHGWDAEKRRRMAEQLTELAELILTDETPSLPPFFWPAPPGGQNPGDPLPPRFRN